MKKMNLILSGSLLVMSLGVLSPAVVYAGAETETAQEDENGEMSWVFDDCGILSDDEITELNLSLIHIYGKTMTITIQQPGFIMLPVPER